MISQSKIESFINEFVTNSPDNTMQLDSGEPSWEEVIVGFANGADPLFGQFKEHVGEYHLTPAEWFNKTFETAPAIPEDLTVISWALLQREATRKENAAEDFYPSKRWVMARFPGERFNNVLRQALVDEFCKIKIEAVAPMLSDHFKLKHTEGYFHGSNWSERHAAYAAGLGTFGLCDGLITYRGKAHRVGSVIARINIPPTARPYTTHNAYCLFYATGKCMSCARRCPVDAITVEGHDKKKCFDHVFTNCGKYIEENFGFKGYGCGLCQTKVPCENEIPKKIRDRM